MSVETDQTEELKRAVAAFLGQESRRRVGTRHIVPVAIGMVGIAGALLLGQGDAPSTGPVLSAGTPTPSASPTAIAPSSSPTGSALAVAARATSPRTGRVVLWVTSNQQVYGVALSVGGKERIDNLEVGKNKFVFNLSPGREARWVVSLAEGQALAKGRLLVSSPPVIEPTLPSSTFAPAPPPQPKPSPKYPDIPIGPTYPIDPEEEQP